MAKKVGKCWKTRQIDMYGQIVERQLYSFTALWYEVCPDRLVKIVIVRDPQCDVEDEYFFSTDLEMSSEDIVLCYTGRWTIEVVFRETKEYLGMDEHQARKKIQDSFSSRFSVYRWCILLSNLPILPSMPRRLFLLRILAWPTATSRASLAC